MYFKLHIYSTLKIEKKMVKIIAWSLYAFLKHLQVLFFLGSEVLYIKKCFLHIIINFSNSLNQPEEKYMKPTITFTVGERSYTLVLTTVVKSKVAKYISQFATWRTKGLEIYILAGSRSSFLSNL